MKTLTLAIAVFLGINSPAIADSIVLAPNSATPPTLAIQVRGTSGSSPARVISSSASVQASHIRLDGCISPYGFAVGSGYTINYSVANVTPGAYVIEYWRGHCTDTGGPAPYWDATGSIVYFPARLTALALLTVMPNGSVSLSAVTNYQGMWWVPSESGWGINFAHQGDILFASWFIYDANGKPSWVSMTATQQSDGSFAGPIDQTSGPAFSAVPYDPAHVTHNVVGTGRVTFSDATFGTFAYTLNGSSQLEPLERFVFAAPMSVCMFDGAVAAVQTVNYEGMWWVPAESGWGINFAHQGDIIFASLFIYDESGKPFWVSATLVKTAAGVYTGALDWTTGPPFNGPYRPSLVTHTTVGTATVSFTDRDNGTFAYTLNGVSRTKALTRFIFRAPGTLCQ